MKKSPWIIIILLFGSFCIPKTQTSNEYSIHIIYLALPGFTHHDYSISGGKMLYKNYIIGLNRNAAFDSIIYILKDPNKIESLIFSTNWSKIPNSIESSQIDGFNVKVRISRLNETFNFDISDSHIPEIDSLFKRCYLSLPNKKAKKNFKLWNRNN